MSSSLRPTCLKRRETARRAATDGHDFTSIPPQWCHGIDCPMVPWIALANQPWQCKPHATGIGVRNRSRLRREAGSDRPLLRWEKLSQRGKKPLGDCHQGSAFGVNSVAPRQKALAYFGGHLRRDRTAVWLRTSKGHACDGDLFIFKNATDRITTQFKPLEDVG